jgi:PiT family inorganic phosphate transporter
MCSVSCARFGGQFFGQRAGAAEYGQGFAANLVTGVLVIFASKLGVPVSTTHVSVGTIFGVGLVTDRRNNTMTGNVLLSWLITLPVAMLFSALAYGILA